MWREPKVAREADEIAEVATFVGTDGSMVPPRARCSGGCNIHSAASRSANPSGLGGPRIEGHWWWWTRPWFEHQNMRDERAEAFSSLLFEGVYAYSYVARATTPGTFVVPPPKAEEMYSPETFGRGAGDRMIVE